MNGIEETKAIQENARKQREEDKKRLAVLKDEFENYQGAKKLNQAQA